MIKYRGLELNNAASIIHKQSLTLNLMTAYGGSLHLVHGIIITLVVYNIVCMFILPLAGYSGPDQRRGPTPPPQHVGQYSDSV